MFTKGFNYFKINAELIKRLTLNTACLLLSEQGKISAPAGN
jgi:hypothetical protein